MPLLDHFHPPISLRRNWEGFHGLWAAAIFELLNRDVLSDEYFADFQIHVGSQVEVDVATLEEPAGSGGAQGLASATLTRQAWTPPAATVAMPVVFPDDIEVQIFSTTAGAQLVGAIELISPGNKDRPETRRAFAAKCVSYLIRGIGVVIVDIVTNRSANLHNETVDALGLGDPFRLVEQGALYTTAYRPYRTSDADRIETWIEPLNIGAALPIQPLWLLNAGVVPLDLDSTYHEALHRSRLP